jgi:hypothetical protein
MRASRSIGCCSRPVWPRGDERSWERVTAWRYFLRCVLRSATAPRRTSRRSRSRRPGHLSDGHTLGSTTLSAMTPDPVSEVHPGENWPLPARRRSSDVAGRHRRLRDREKAHTREGDAIAAARRRLPMVEVDAKVTVVGPHGPVTLLDVFEGRRQLSVYFHMWHDGMPAKDQCEGCTFFNGQVRELSYLHSRDVTYATFCEGLYDESARYRDFMGWDVPWYSARDSPSSSSPGVGSGSTRTTCATVTGSSRRTGRRGEGAEKVAPTLRVARHVAVRPTGGLRGLSGRLAAVLRE